MSMNSIFKTGIRTIEIIVLLSYGNSMKQCFRLFESQIWEMEYRKQVTYKLLMLHLHESTFDVAAL